jgi:hypothetical protein
MHQWRSGRSFAARRPEQAPATVDAIQGDDAYGGLSTRYAACPTLRIGYARQIAIAARCHRHRTRVRACAHSWRPRAVEITPQSRLDRDLGIDIARLSGGWRFTAESNVRPIAQGTECRELQQLQHVGIALVERAPLVKNRTSNSCPSVRNLGQARLSTLISINEVAPRGEAPVRSGEGCIRAQPARLLTGKHNLNPAAAKRRLR